MTKTVYITLLNNLRSAVSELSPLVYELYLGSDFNVEDKADRSRVTSADIMASDFLIQKISSFSDIPILSEERVSQTPSQTDTFWIIDPIDGTDNFIEKADGEFCIMISLIEKGRPVISLIDFPALGFCADAIRGEGAWRTEKGKTTRIKIAPKNGIKNQRLAVSRHRFKESEKQFADQAGIEKIITIGSCGLKLVRIAEGQAELYINLSGLKIWDLAPPALILEEAGGTVCNLQGEPFIYNTDNVKVTPGIIASSAEADVISEIRRIGLEVLG